MTSKDSTPGYDPLLQPGYKMRMQLIAASLLFSTAESVFLKRFVDILRPCQSGAEPVTPSLYLLIYDTIHGGCLPDHAYPSIHTAVVFSVLFPLLGHRLFPPVYLAGLLIGWSRVFYGEHSWYDIGGGIAVAGLSYAVASAVSLPRREMILKIDERPRQMVHASVGLLLCITIILFGIQPAQYLVLSGTVAGLLIVHLTLMGVKLPVVDALLGRLERKGAMPGEGSMYYALGVLFALGLLRENALAAISVILILSIGDGLSTWIGLDYGHHPLPWNRNKTLEGSLGFVAGAAVSAVIYPSPATILAVLVAAIVESASQKVNDNIAIPFAASLVYYFTAIKF